MNSWNSQNGPIYHGLSWACIFDDIKQITHARGLVSRMGALLENFFCAALQQLLLGMSTAYRTRRSKCTFIVAYELEHALISIHQ